MKWRDIEGREWKLTDMSTLHLINAIAQLWRVTAARTRHVMDTMDADSLRLVGTRAHVALPLMLAELARRDQRKEWK